MNLIFTQSNHRSLNIRWQPFATSTPLKLVPSNVNVEKNSPSQLKLSTDSYNLISKLNKDCTPTNDTKEKNDDLKQLVAKLLIKKKSGLNLELSSSSDEDDASENRRPVIKLGLKNQTNSLLKSKKPEGRGTKVVRSKNTIDSNLIATCTKASKYDVKGSKQKYNMCNSKKKKQNDNGNVELDNLCSDEENQIFDEINCGNLTNDTRLSLNKEEDKERYCKHLSNCKFKKNKSGNDLKTCSCISKDSQTSKSLQKFNFEHKVLRKRKCSSIEQTSNSVKTFESKKAKNKLLTSFKSETKKNAVASLLLSESKTHQLFSDSREQELINTLNLTSEEVIETNENLLKNKFTQSSLNLPHPSNQIDFIEKQNSDRTRKSNLKKCKFTKNKLQLTIDSENQFGLEKNLQIFKETNDHIQEPQKKIEDIPKPSEDYIDNDLEKHNLNYKETERKGNKKVISKIGKERKTLSVKNSSNDIKISYNDNNVKSNSDLVENVSIKEKLHQPSQHVESEGNTLAQRQVFKLLKDLSYNEDKTGCSAAECWNVNTFKCGVFRLKIKSKMNCRTLHSNSHLGGVLIKGNLRMKIGSQEMDLQHGDMAFVPPLTDWQATNIGTCESVFYYWCGRFKV